VHSGGSAQVVEGGGQRRATSPLPCRAQFFHGRLVHAGAAYSQPNLRLHTYLSPRRALPEVSTYFTEEA